MPKKYLKKTNRCEISETRLKLAIKAVLSNRLSQYRAAEEYQVKRQTIQSRIKKLMQKKTKEQILQELEDSGHESEREFAFSSKYTSQQVFSSSQEVELVTYIKRCSDLNYGLNYKQIRALAYEYSRSIVTCKTPNNWELNKIAGLNDKFQLYFLDSSKYVVGLDWLRGFMARHRNELSLRKPENTSISRSMAFNKPVVAQFFEKYASVLEKYKFPPGRIYNLDETGLTTVTPPVKVVATKGKKQVAHISSQERGELVTFVGIICADGSAVPPVFVYPRVRDPEQYLGSEYPNSAVALGNKKGWMTSILFPKVILHFVNYVKCSPENKVLLMVDNHESHISVESIKLCREKGVVLMSFPPHTTHKMQPLDVGVYGPFKSYFATAQHDWLLSNPAQVITIRHLAFLAKKAFESAFTIKNIVSAFKNTGLYPLDRLIFSDADFMASEVTEKPLSENIPPLNHTQDNINLQQKTGPASPIPSTSNDDQNNSINNNSLISDTSVTITLDGHKTPPLPSQTPSLCEIRPYPKAPVMQKTKKVRQKSKASIYTDTPEYENRQRIEEERKRKRALNENKSLLKSVKRSLVPSAKKRHDSTSSESSVRSNVYIPEESSGDEDFWENLKMLSEEDKISVGNFVLVKFIANKTEVYYVGKVISIDKEYEVKFLRRKGKSDCFLFPDVDDISTVPLNDIVAILPHSTAQGTSRTSCVYKFNINFSSLNVR